MRSEPIAGRQEAARRRSAHHGQGGGADRRAREAVRAVRRNGGNSGGSVSGRWSGRGAGNHSPLLAEAGGRAAPDAGQQGRVAGVLAARRQRGADLRDYRAGRSAAQPYIRGRREPLRGGTRPRHGPHEETGGAGGGARGAAKAEIRRQAEIIRTGCKPTCRKRYASLCGLRFFLYGLSK